MAHPTTSGGVGHLPQKTCENATLEWIRTFNSVNVKDFEALADGDALHSILARISPESVEQSEDRRGKELLLHVVDQIGHLLYFF